MNPRIPAYRTFAIEAVTVAVPYRTWRYTQNRLPAFALLARCPESAARAACRVLLATRPGTEWVTATASDGSTYGTVTVKAMRNGRIEVTVDAEQI